MKVVIAGGGTGGHLYPGIAIARELLREEGSEVLFVGTREGIEAKVLPREGLPVRYIAVGKLKGMGLRSVMRTLFTLPRSFTQSASLLRSERPDVVVGVGGYASGPVAVAAWCLRIPLLIVEPNSYAGLANRKVGKLADKVILSFPGTGSERFFPPGKTEKTGPLVRRSIEEGSREKALAAFGLDPEGFTVFIMGGSGGAHAINMAMKEAARILTDVERLQVLQFWLDVEFADLLKILVALVVFDLPVVVAEVVDRDIGDHRGDRAEFPRAFPGDRVREHVSIAKRPDFVLGKAEHLQVQRVFARVGRKQHSCGAENRKENQCIRSFHLSHRV